MAGKGEKWAAHEARRYEVQEFLSTNLAGIALQDLALEMTRSIRERKSSKAPALSGALNILAETGEALETPTPSERRLWRDGWRTALVHAGSISKVVAPTRQRRGAE
ncbi:MAG: hypothetical protein ACYDDF_08845 [Thermoplasmatota archaeon]